MLRDYQIQAVNDIENCEEKNILLQMPTGAGKTFTFCEIAKRFFIENIEKVLILVHRSELLEQAKKSLGERVFSIEKGVKVIPTDFDYYVGMVETLHRRLDKLPPFGLVIIDECHIGNFKKMPFFKDIKTKVIGVTATPINDEPLANYYNRMIMPTSIDSLINNSYLLNCDVYGVASDLVGLQKFKEKRGEFDEKQLEDFYSSEKMVKNVINAYWDFSAGKKTLIFNVNVAHNEVVYRELKEEGLNVYRITGETESKERKEILRKFKEESDAILCNVGVLTTGFDEPSIQTIVLNRATKSLALYLQMVGRGSRLYENKERFKVIDLGKNTIRHGFYDGYFDWNTYFLKGRKSGSDGTGVMPIKECPECNFMQHTRKVVCENCGHDFVAEREAQQKEEQEQKLYLLTKEKPILVPIEQIFDLAEQRNWKPYAVLYKIVDHIINYKNKHSSIVTDDFCEKQCVIELSKWCEKYEKKFNKWHKDFIVNIYNEKTGKVTV
jgi:superfamily II DNA or RNA helicase